MNVRDALRIYELALDLEGTERSSWIAAQSAGDESLRLEVERLLRAAQRAERVGFLDRPVRLALAEAASAQIHADRSAHPEPAWPQIDRYQLLEVLGEGGFGTVYRAQQLRPVRRIVALKLMRSDRCEPSFIRRFETERQTLARLSHPGIAQIYDAGTTTSGDPYLAMECVAGEPITDYCDHRQLSLKARVRVMVSVCAAVQHAHQKGVIHRDLKPPNVLVTDEDGRPAAKVIDFGIARAVDWRIDDRSLETGASLLGSPMYMSPEQVDPQTASDIDTRSDVYSLGVLLYELLCGLTPFAPRGGSLLEVLRQIKEFDPSRPSVRAASASAEVALARGCNAVQLTRQLAGELDWIVLRAIEKRRERRYDSAAALAADLDRYLTDQPIEARPPSRTYRVGKFVRRNRIAVGATLLLMVSLMVGAVGSAVGFWHAQRQAVRAQQTVALLQEFLASPAPAAQGRDLTVLQLLENFEARVDALTDRPETQADLLQTYAQTYLSLGRYDRARAFAQRGLSLNQRLHGSADRRTLAATSLIGAIELQAGDYSAAAALQERAFDSARARFGDQDMDTIGYAVGLAEALSKLAKDQRAVELHRYALAHRRERLGPDHADTLHSMNRLSLALSLRGENAEAEQLSLEAVARRTQHFGPDHPDTLSAMSDLAYIYGETGRFRESAEVDRVVLERRVRVLGESHRKTFVSMNNLAWVLDRLGEYEEAEALYRRALAALMQTLGADVPETLAVKGNLAMILKRLGQLDEADALIQEALQGRQDLLGMDHPSTLLSTSNLIEIRQAQRRLDEALALSQALVERSTRVNGPSHGSTLNFRSQLSGLLADKGDYAQAVAVARAALPERLARSGPERESTLVLKLNLARALAAQHEYAEAEELARAVVQQRQRNLGEEHPYTQAAQAVLEAISKQK